MEVVFECAKWRLFAWLLVNKEFENISMSDLYRSWVGCIARRPRKESIREVWCPPSMGVFKFNVDGEVRGKLGPTGIGGVLRNSERAILLFFIESIGVKDSNEAELVGIRRTLGLWVHFGQGKLIIEGDSMNAIK